MLNQCTSLENRVRIVMEGYMSLLPECYVKEIGYFRTFCSAKALPFPSWSFSQWDMGDCTSRAVQAWNYVRLITGDLSCGRNVQEGQVRFMLSLVNPATGLVIVPEIYSDVLAGKYYYHMWDQGRTLRALISEYEFEDTGIIGKKKAGDLIKAMLKGLYNLAVKSEDPRWGKIAYFPHQAYYDFQGIQGSGFVTPAGQLIEPLAKYIELTGNEEALDIALQFMRGAKSGYEGQPTGDTFSSVFFWTPEGGFSGHFHSHASMLYGAVKLGQILFKIGREEEGWELINWVASVYSWIFDSMRNPNVAGTWGWFPEHTGKENTHRVLNETCCTADMIELSSSLGECYNLGKEFQTFSSYWDDVERFTINELFRAQLTDVIELENFLIVPSPYTIDEAKNRLMRVRGGWAAFHYPNDLIITANDGTIDTATVPEIGTLNLGGCCQYSGVRGLYACWKSVIREIDGYIQIEIPMSRRHSKLDIEVNEDVDVTMRIMAKSRIKVRMRISSAIKRESLRIKRKDGLSSQPITTDSTYLDLKEFTPGEIIEVTWIPQECTTQETVGGNNHGVWRCSQEERISYTVKWRGNRVVSLLPAGKFLSVFPSR